MYKVKLDFPQVLGFLLKIILSMEEVWIFYASAQFWQLHNKQYWHKSTSPFSPSSTIVFVNCFKVLKLFNYVIVPHKQCFLFVHLNVVWQTGQTCLPSLAFMSSTRRSASSFHSPLTLVCSFCKSWRGSWIIFFFWSHKEIEASYQYLTNFQNYYNVVFTRNTKHIK